MRAVALIAFALLVATASARRPKWFELDGYTFDKYVRDFHKGYVPGTAEHEKRRKIFEKKLTEVRAHNAGKSSYKKGINDFSDKTHEEFKVRLGSKVHEQYPLIQALKEQPHVKAHKSSGNVLPQQVDWRNRVPSILTGVKDQGDCGSCWAHGSTENLESHWALATGELFTLSQQEVTACAPNPQQCGGTGGCGGSTAELAYTYVSGQTGIAQEWTYPYTAYTGTTGTCRSTFTRTDVNISGYTAVTPNSQSAVMDALAHTGPLVVNVEADTWGDYELGIFDGCSYNISIDHVVQLVGYGTDDDSGKDYWIIRNSWSPHWGEKGYIRLIRHSTPQCGWDVNPQDGTGCKNGPAQLWACGQCGVLFDTLYPNVSP